MEKALKFDEEKPRMDLVPAGAQSEIAKVFTFGAKKYADHNWRKGFKWSRLIASLERHIAAFKEGEDNDPESGMPHMAHAGCCVMMLLEHQLKKYGTDDRYTATLPHSDDIWYKVYSCKEGTYINIEGNKFFNIPTLEEYWIKDLDITPIEKYFGKSLYKTVSSRSGFVQVRSTWCTKRSGNAPYVRGML